MTADPTRLEGLSAADRIIQTLLEGSDHLVHHRTGIVTPDARHRIGVRWAPATCREVEGKHIVYGPRARGQKEAPILGERLPTGDVVSPTGSPLGCWQPAGLFEPAVLWTFRQVLDIYRMDSEFVARWASWAFAKENRDLKVVLAAFLLVQPRSGRPLLDALGKPVRDADGHPLVVEEDDREVGEALLLLRRTDKLDLNPKLVLRVGEVLRLPVVAALVREAGFGAQGRGVFLGRYPAAVTAWLRSRERNPKLMAPLVKAGFRQTVIRLARSVRYKPESHAFFSALRWKQAQAKDGRRSVGIGEAVGAAEDWSKLTEEQVCTLLMTEKPAWKRAVGLIPPNIGVTPAVLAAAIEAGCLSNADLVAATPTIEELGLLTIASVRARWDAAVKAADNQRVRNIAKNVKDTEAKAKLEEAADAAAAKVAEEATRGLRVNVCVDISGSMNDAIAQAKRILVRLLAGFPPSRLRIVVFNQGARTLTLPAGTTAHVAGPVIDALFSGINANGGTLYHTAVNALAADRAAPEEDVVFLFVGDEEDGAPNATLCAALQSVPNLIGLALVRVPSSVGHNACPDCVQRAAATLRLPLAVLRPEDINMDDAYRIPGQVRALLAAAPRTVRVDAPRRKSLVEEILETPRLTKPAWARVA